MSDEEFWRAVPDYEGRYEVSTHGRVRSLGWKVSFVNRWGKKQSYWKAPRRLSLEGKRVGGVYQAVSLFRRDGSSQTITVHRLVCEAFYGTPQAGQVVRHLDGNATNNCRSNLAWGTNAENQRDRVKHGTAGRGEQHGGSRLTEDQVRQIRAASGTVKLIAEAFGISMSWCWAIRRRTAWKHIL